MRPGSRTKAWVLLVLTQTRKGWESKFRVWCERRGAALNLGSVNEAQTGGNAFRLLRRLANGLQYQATPGQLASRPAIPRSL